MGDKIQISIVCPGYVDSDFRKGEEHNTNTKIMSPSQCALHVLRAEQDNTREIILTFSGALFVTLRPFLPARIADLLVQRKQDSLYKKQE